jgi:hypothetical protein
MPVCQICQHNNPSGADFCEECGASMSAPTPASAAAPSTPVPATPPATGSPAQAGSPGPVGAAVSGAPSPGAVTNPAPSPGAAASSAAAPEVVSSPAVTPENGTAAEHGAAPTSVTTDLSQPAASDTGSSSTEQPAPQGPARLLAIRHGAPTGEEIPLLGQRMIIGRFDPETGPVDIDLSSSPDSAHISRQHAELYHEAESQWMVRDLGSTNGVFVRGGGEAAFGPRISEPRALQNNDEVAFGNARFVFRIS